MPPIVATFVFFFLIVGLFWADRDGANKVSKALWVPVFWLMISGSRPISQWMEMLGLGSGVAPVGSQERIYIDGSPLDRNIFICLLVAGLTILFRRRQQVSALFQRNVPILLFFLYCGLSVSWSDYPFVSFKRWMKAIGDVVIVFIVLTEEDPEAALKRLISRCAYILLPISMLFIKYYPEWGREYNVWTWLPAYSGVTETKNELGLICLVFGLGCFWRVLLAYRYRKESPKTRVLIANSTIVLMMLWLLHMANSVTSMSSFMVAGCLLVMTMLTHLGKRSFVIHTFVASVILVSLLAMFGGGAIVESLGRDPTLTGRTGIWTAVLSVSGSPLFGTGFESFWMGDRLLRVWSMTMDGLQEAHNGYVEVYLNLGWVGIILLAGIIVTGYRNAIISFRRNPNVGSLRLAMFLIALIYNLAEAGFRETMLIWIFFLMASSAVPDSLLQPATTKAEVEPEFVPLRPRLNPQRGHALNFRATDRSKI